MDEQQESGNLSQDTATASELAREESAPPVLADEGEDSAALFSEDDADLFWSEEEAYLDRLELLLQREKLAGGMNLIEMDGFLHGIICQPGLFPPSMFLPFILGDESDTPLFGRDDELEETVALILRYYEELLQLVDDGLFYSSPCISVFSDNDEDEWENLEEEIQEGLEDTEDSPEKIFEEQNASGASPLEIPLEEERAKDSREEKVPEAPLRKEAAEWARAFLLALEVRGGIQRILSEGPREEHRFLTPILLLAHNALPTDENSSDREGPLTLDECHKAVQILPTCVDFLYTLLHQPVRKSKISRNAPCPCGSGKKYKKCCLNKPLSEQSFEGE